MDGSGFIFLGETPCTEPHAGSSWSDGIDCPLILSMLSFGKYEVSDFDGSEAVDGVNVAEKGGYRPKPVCYPFPVNGWSTMDNGHQRHDRSLIFRAFVRLRFHNNKPC